MTSPEDYLLHLIKTDCSPRWAFLFGSDSRFDIERWRKRYGLSEEQVSLIRAFRGYIREHPHINPYYLDRTEDHYLSLLIARALSHTRELQQELKDVPVGLAILDDVNACVIKTPSQHRAILINNYVFFVFPLAATLIYDYLMLEERGESSASDRDLLFARMATLATFDSDAVFDRSEGYLSRMTEILALRPDGSDITLARLIDQLVLLHEYGHLVCGHLQEESTRMLKLGRDVESIEVYNTDWARELAADSFAFRSMVEGYAELLRHSKANEEGVLIVRSSLLNAACLLFGLMEIKRVAAGQHFPSGASHPRPWDRWVQIRTSHTDFHNSLTDRLSGLIGELIGTIRD